MDIVRILLAGLLGYLLGSISFSVLLSVSQYNDDVRNHGSGNAGMTNMLRTFGKWAAILVFAGDFGKGLLATWLGGLIGGAYGAMAATFMVVLGHVFPVFFQFRGGKGVATAAGAILMLQPKVLLVLAAVFVVVVAVSRYVSLASICAAMSYPVAVLVMGLPVEHLVLAIVLASLIIWLHRANIGRLMKGTESKLGQKAAK